MDSADRRQPREVDHLKRIQDEIDRLRPHYQGRGLDQARIQMLDHFENFINNMRDTNL